MIDYETREFLEKVISEIENGKSLSEIVGRYNSKTKRLIFENCGERGRKALILDFEKTTPILDIIQLYNNGRKLTDIEKELGLGKGQVGKLMSDYEFLTGEEIYHLYSGIRYDLDEKKIIEEYRSGKTIRQIARENGSSDLAISKRIIEYMSESGEDLREEHQHNYNKIYKKNGEVRVEKRKSKNTKNKRKNIDNEEIYNDRKSGMELKELAEKYGVSISTICNRLREYVIEHDIYEIPDNKIDKEKKKKELKVTTRYSIENILKKYNYSYEELSSIALEAGYVVPKDIYYSVLEDLKKARKGEER